MIIAPVRARSAFANGRLDAKFHCSPGVLASERMTMLSAAGVDLRPIEGVDGLGSVGPVSRTKRVYAAEGEDFLPYLRPYDVFDYLPQSADHLSKSGSPGIEKLVPAVGTILQTCSGRNLGPVAYVDSFLNRFVVSDDMLRIWIEDEDERLYALAFLSTPTGQALLTRNKTGNVIDHLSAVDLAAVEVPFFGTAITSDVAKTMKQALAKREIARIRLVELIDETAAALPSRPVVPPMREGWTQNASKLAGRLDAAYYDPEVAHIRSELESAGGTRLGEVAIPEMPNRYKRRYVESDHGRPILSGRQLLQLHPVNLQFIADASLDFSAYELGENTIAFGARGRAEDRIANPTLIAKDRANWLASHNIMRVRAKPGVNAGWLYLTIATRQVQAQIKAGAFGSVVDVVDPAGLSEILLPPEDVARGNEALKCWADLADAGVLEDLAIAKVENAVRAGSF